MNHNEGMSKLNVEGRNLLMQIMFILILLNMCIPDKQHLNYCKVEFF